MMISRKLLPKNFRYYVDGMNTAEEVELIFKLFEYGKVENLTDTLLFYRIHGANTSLKDLKKTFLLTLLSRYKAIIAYNYHPTISGILATIAEAAVVLLLPKVWTLKAYGLAKQLMSDPSSTITSMRLAIRSALFI
jgi:hypothetical protein